MTSQIRYTVLPAWSALIQEQGWEALPDLPALVINAAMRAEHDGYLGAGRYGRSSERWSHANGFRPKTVQTRLGDLTSVRARVHDDGFNPHALTKGLRSERALRWAPKEFTLRISSDPGMLV